MGTIDVTAIILALISLVNGCGWLLDRRKHKQEVESLKADNDRKYLDLVTEFATKFRELIVTPLEAEVMKLRTEVNELKDAVQKVYDCPFSSDCPVRERMRGKQDSGGSTGVAKE